MIQLSQAFAMHAAIGGRRRQRTGGPPERLQSV